MCLIEGNCYKEGDGHPDAQTSENRPTCRPEHSQSSWHVIGMHVLIHHTS